MAFFKASPYSFKDTLKWLWYNFFPSTKMEEDCQSAPTEFNDEQLAGEETMIMSFVGDLMCLPGEVVPIPHESMKEIFRRSDIVVGNLEAPLVSEKKRHDFNAFVFSFSEEFLREFMDEYGIEAQKLVLTVANNHIGDQGEDGLVQTEKRVSGMGVQVVGTKNDLAKIPARMVNGFNIGFLAWSEWLNCTVFNEGEGIVRQDDVIELDISKIKMDSEVDFMIALPHWGYEFRHFPERKTRKLAKMLVQNGVDLISGHHPHVLRPIEMISGSPCHYSLGNFFARTIHWATKITGIWEVEIVRNGDHKGRIARWKFHPYFMMKEGKKIIFKPLSEAPEKVRKRFDLVYGVST